MHFRHFSREFSVYVHIYIYNEFPARSVRLCAYQTWSGPKSGGALSLICMKIWGYLKPDVMLNLNCSKIWGEVKSGAS